MVGEHTDRVHVLVNNAGAAWGAPLEDFPASGWDKVLDLNLKSPFFLTRSFLPCWRPTRPPTARHG
ncbi:MAG: 3-oxoacyl-[acyl-carrier-protein] reductase [Modestobacter sp.]|nr:3-oxoacyl-[acyl-carrier-protein] reductase [Modestobacter sp.]